MVVVNRGSHSSNFYSNKNRGREDDDDVKDEYKKKTPSKGNVKKLLTGKRLHATTQVGSQLSSPDNIIILPSNIYLIYVLLILICYY